MLSEKMLCDLIHSEDTFIVTKIGRWSRFENEAKGTQTNMSLEVRLTWTGSDVTADFFFLESVKWQERTKKSTTDVTYLE